MREPALKAGLWVKAQLRLCNVNMVAAYISRKGDPDAGAILIRLDRLDGTSTVLSQVRTAEGARAWMRGTGDAPVADAEADAYIKRQAKFDPDIWVLEIEDPNDAYEPDDDIV
jgi:hypothetical protein